MRNEEVIKAFKRREKARSSTGSLWSTGDCLYSYNTCIAEYSKKGNLYINLTEYSTTTSHHQTLVNRHLYDYANKFLFYIQIGTTHIIPKYEEEY